MARVWSGNPFVRSLYPRQQFHSIKPHSLIFRAPSRMHLESFVVPCSIFFLTAIASPAKPILSGSPALRRERSFNLIDEDICCSIGCDPDCPDGYICDHSSSGDTGCCPTGDDLCDGGSWCCPQGTSCEFSGSQVSCH